jgi:ParB-like chromosome segregation protein Spo0J
MKEENIKLTELRQHPDYIRGQHSKSYVSELVTALKDSGKVWPFTDPRCPIRLQPIPTTDKAYADGARFWILDGTHRVAASLEFGRETVPAVIEQPLTSLDAIALQVKTNNAHGLRLSVTAQTNAIKKLKENGMKQKMIAEKTGLTEASVSRIIGGTQRTADKNTPEGTEGTDTATPPKKKTKPFKLEDWIKGLHRTLKGWEKYGGKIRKSGQEEKYNKALDILAEMLHATEE